MNWSKCINCRIPKLKTKGHKWCNWLPMDYSGTQFINKMKQYHEIIYNIKSRNCFTLKAAASNYICITSNTSYPQNIQKQMQKLFPYHVYDPKTYISKIISTIPNLPVSLNTWNKKIKLTRWRWCMTRWGWRTSVI